MSDACKKPAADCLFPPWNCLAKQYKVHGLVFFRIFKYDFRIDSQELAREQQEDQKKANIMAKSLCKKVIGLEKKDSL